MTMIFTLGYLRTDPVDVHKLTAVLNAFLLDVRFSPHSGIPAWKQSHLKANLGNRYIHCRGLSNVNEFRPDQGVKLKDFNGGLGIVRPILRHNNVILMCVCHDLDRCHRLEASARLGRILNVPVLHLDGEKLPLILSRQLPVNRDDRLIEMLSDCIFTLA